MVEGFEHFLVFIRLKRLQEHNNSLCPSVLPAASDTMVMQNTKKKNRSFVCLFGFMPEGPYLLGLSEIVPGSS